MLSEGSFQHHGERQQQLSVFQHRGQLPVSLPVLYLATVQDTSTCSKTRIKNTVKVTPDEMHETSLPQINHPRDFEAVCIAACLENIKTEEAVSPREGSASSNRV